MKHEAMRTIHNPLTTRKASALCAALTSSLVLSSGNLLAACRDGLPIGRVESVAQPPEARAPQRIEADGSKIPVRAYQHVCAKDRFEIEGPSRIIITTANGVELTLDSQRKIVPAAENERTTPNLQFLGKLLDQLQGPAARIPYFNQSRDPTTDAATQLSPHSLLPLGKQSLPRGYKRVAVLWEGGAAQIVYQRAAVTLEKFDSGRRAFAILTLPEVGGTLRVGAKSLSWPIAFDAPPVPKDQLDRLNNAVLILRSGPSEFRLLALSELSTLSNDGMFAAEEIWTAALTGRLSQALTIP